MTNAELIKAIRENDECNNCAIWKPGECNERKMSLAAADALEAADKRIDGLQKLVDINTERCEALRKQLREANESYDRRIAELEKDIIYWQTYAAENER